MRAETVLRATEGYTAALAGRAAHGGAGLLAGDRHRAAAGRDLGRRSGCARRETFTDHRHLIIYGQRTADDRLVFGGRGAPYHFGSRIRPDFDRDERSSRELRETLVDLFPVLAGARITHAWGGALGIPRDWCASVGLDRGDRARLGRRVRRRRRRAPPTSPAGPCATSCSAATPSSPGCPWVGHRSRRWEPEPLRWLGINAGLRAMTLADAEERLTRRPSLVARAVAPLLGD